MIGNRFPLRVSFRQALDFITTVAILAACGALTWMVISHERGRTPPVYQIGEQIEPIEGLDFKSFEGPTLVLYLASTCRFCTQNMPFYRQLASVRGRTRLAVVGLEPREVLLDYAKNGGLQVDLVLSVRAGLLKLPATPMLVLVAPDGRIRALWRGLLSTSEQGEVLSMVE